MHDLAYNADIIRMTCFISVLDIPIIALIASENLFSSLRRVLKASPESLHASLGPGRHCVWPEQLFPSTVAAKQSMRTFFAGVNKRGNGALGSRLKWVMRQVCIEASNESFAGNFGFYEEKKDEEEDKKERLAETGKKNKKRKEG